MFTVMGDNDDDDGCDGCCAFFLVERWASLPSLHPLIINKRITVDFVG